MSLLSIQAPLSWNHTPNEIIEHTKDAIRTYKNALDLVGSLPPRDCTFDSVFLALANAETAFDTVVEPLSFYQNVSGSSEIRDASSSAESLARDFSIERTMHVDVFNSKVSAEQKLRQSGQWDKLSSEEQRLVEKMILESKRAGLSLPVEKREELINLKKQLSKLRLEFKKNFNEENGRNFFTREELIGIDDESLSGYPRHSQGEVELFETSFMNENPSQIIGHAVNPETRRRMQEAHDSRLAVNVPVLERIFDIRRQIAKILGYKSWADYVTEDRMIKTGKAVQDFLNDLEEKLLPIGIKDREALLTMKKVDCEANKLPFDAKLYLWDYGYYSTKYIEKELGIDSTVIREYFPVSVVVPAILDLYQNLFELKFEKLENASIWHPDVQAYSVWRKGGVNEQGFIGYTYLDLYSRLGKHSHISLWHLISGYELPSGKRNYPVDVMVAGLAQPTPNKPSLMRHHDVVMFFHEMGHVFHDLLSQTKFGRFHGTSGALDFVETPSQMLENWCWEPRILERISSHYLTGMPMPPDMSRRLVRNRDMLVGLFQLQQLFYAKFDLEVHLDQVFDDYTKFWCEMRQKTSLCDHLVCTPAQAAFQHLAGGYDVGYYGYLYSTVFAADMYMTIFKDDPLDPARAKLYEDKVLSPGSSKDENDILKDFLGRPPNNEAFLQQLLKGQEEMEY